VGTNPGLLFQVPAVYHLHITVKQKMKTSDFDYLLPPELIAQTPAEPRDQSRLMVINRGDGSIRHHRFHEIVGYLQTGDILVFNDSRVIPARLHARKDKSGGKVEILLLRRLSPNIWETLVRPARRIKTGTKLGITNPTTGNGVNLSAEVVGIREDGIRIIDFSNDKLLPELGEMALPPYIHASLADPERYQTVYARATGSVAAPTAGLHFTPELIEETQRKAIQCLFVTLHVGLGTFRPVREADPLRHTLYQEYGVLSRESANHLSQARAEGRRIICVGTTTTRLVEAVAQAGEPLHLEPFTGWVSLFILPGYRFRMTDALITNFHLPRSTLLMLVTAFTGRDFINQAYQEAITKKYRFYSFGDAMLII
jgi:S-adenosylmethionine:tRNA ribosyltransferase-isomerase